MTTYDRSGLRPAGVRLVPHAPRRVRVLHTHERLHWWHGRVVLGCVLAGLMTGALAGVAVGYVQRGLAPWELLLRYGAGAGLGMSVGLVVGTVASAAVGLVHRYLLPRVVRRRPVWVLHRRSR